MFSGHHRILDAYILEKKKAKINNLSLYFKNVEKEEQNKSKASRRRRIVRLRSEFSELDTEKQWKENWDEREARFKDNKTDKPPESLSKLKEKRCKLRSLEKQGYHDRPCRHKKRIREYYKHLYTY